MARTLAASIARPEQRRILMMISDGAPVDDSTLSVNPAAMIPALVARNGKPYVIINRGDTDHDPVATLRIEGDVTEVLPAAVAAL